MEFYYNIHNLITIGIITQRPHIIKEYEYYIRDFKIPEKLGEVDLLIQDLEAFSLPKDASVIEKGIYGFKNGIYNKKEAYAIVIENNKIRLYTKDTNISSHVLIEYLLLKKGFTFMHAAAISYKDKGIIFPAAPNTGKTMLISRLRKKENIKFFGDDFVIIGNGQLYSYPSDFSIYKYHFDFFPELKKTSASTKIKKAFFERIIVMTIRNLPIKKAIKGFANKIGYSYLMGGEYLKIPAKNLIIESNMGQQVNLAHAVLLEKSEKSSLEEYSGMTSESAAKEMINMLRLEWKDSWPVLNLLSQANLLSGDVFFNNIHEVVAAELGKIRIHKVFLPREMNNEKRTDELEKFLEKVVFA